MLMGLGSLWDFSIALKDLGAWDLDFIMTVRGLAPLWDLNTTLFWMPSADAGLRDRWRKYLQASISQILHSIIYSCMKVTSILQISGSQP